VLALTGTGNIGIMHAKWGPRVRGDDGFWATLFLTVEVRAQTAEIKKDPVRLRGRAFF
jgi:hypothetical protein